jgi:ABC-type transporter lipoprotein component MlaA
MLIVRFILGLALIEAAYLKMYFWVFLLIAIAMIAAFIMVPFFGFFSLRDGLGRLGDMFLDPIWWLFDDIWALIAIRAGEAVNDTSPRIGEYEARQEAALNPYLMIRNAYAQNRNELIQS